MVHVAVCWASMLYDSQTYWVARIVWLANGPARSRVFPQFRNEGKRHPELCASTFFSAACARGACSGNWGAPNLSNVRTLTATLPLVAYVMCCRHSFRSVHLRHDVSGSNSFQRPWLRGHWTHPLLLSCCFVGLQVLIKADVLGLVLSSNLLWKHLTCYSES